MRQVIFAVSLLGAFLAGMGFLSNWWTGRFETNYGPTIHLLTKVYGAAAVIFSAAALAAAFAPKKKEIKAEIDRSGK